MSELIIGACIYFAIGGLVALIQLHARTQVMRICRKRGWWNELAYVQRPPEAFVALFNLFFWWMTLILFARGFVRGAQDGR